VCGAVDYCRIFRTLRTPYNNLFHPDNKISIEKDSPSSLWLLQIAHQTRLVPDPSGRRIFFINNFYTRHQLAYALKVMMDGEARMIGTVRFSNVDCTNRFYLQQAIDLIDAKPRGSWCLVQAYDEHPELAACQRQHQARNKDIEKSQRQKFVPPTHHISPDSGYILFKDSKVVIFYSNDLDGTPPHPIMDGSDEESVRLCRGVRSTSMVPAPIIASNMFMNGVDQMDQLRSTNITQRREKRLYMTVFTMCLDLVAHQAFCLYNAMLPNKANRKHQILLSFKQQVAQFLVEPELKTRMASKCNPVAVLPTARETSKNISDTLGHIEETHMLVRNLTKKKNRNKQQDIPCYLCKLRGFDSRTIYGCPTCKAGFHVECFTAFHYKDALKGNMKALLDMLKASEVAGKRRKKSNNYIGSLDLLTLPPSQQQKIRVSTSRQSDHDESDNSSTNDSSSLESDNGNRVVKCNRTTG
jgi:hypothetical protein